MIDTESLRTALSLRVMLHSLAVAIVVGSALNLINQGGAIFSDEMTVWWKIGLTYVIPFFVASYGAYSALASDRLDTES